MNDSSRRMVVVWWRLAVAVLWLAVCGGMARANEPADTTAVATDVVAAQPHDSEDEDDFFPRFTVGFEAIELETGLRGSEECMLAGAVGHYAVSKWVHVGGTVGVLYSKHARQPGDTVHVVKPFIQPSVLIRPPGFGRICSWLYVCPTLEVGMTLVPSYKSRMYKYDNQYSYTTDCSALTVCAGFFVSLMSVPIQINYAFSTLDDRRKVDPLTGEMRRRPMHGFAIGMRVLF